MAYQVKWMPNAQSQRKEILHYGLQAFGLNAARKMRESIIHMADLLERNPYMGMQEPLLSHYTYTYRSFVFHANYKLVYRVNEATYTIIVVAIWDTRREPKSLANDIDL